MFNLQILGKLLSIAVRTTCSGETLHKKCSLRKAYIPILNQMVKFELGGQILVKIIILNFMKIYGTVSEENHVFGETEDRRCLPFSCSFYERSSKNAVFI
jgi:hypothetical protein